MTNFHHSLTLNYTKTSVSHPQCDQISFNHTVREYHAAGDEVLTLSAIWKHCRENPTHEQKVIYLHSKGSFNDIPKNERLRQFATKGAMSRQCVVDLLDQSNTCASRVSSITPPSSSHFREYVACSMRLYSQIDRPCHGFCK